MDDLIFIMDMGWIDTFMSIMLGAEILKVLQERSF
jgi:hypothetical protein